MLTWTWTTLLCWFIHINYWFVCLINDTVGRWSKL